ncbi:hypothetical protein EBB07_24650 [Paenibacillaceae bacterium]|nr:hypothetical protein EBB07_24650 [Paenibacillaceae bacterium]
MLLRIRLYELRKALLSPIILILIVVFCALNLLLVLQYSYLEKNLSVLNRLVDRFGFTIDQPFTTELESYYNEQLSELNKKTQQTASQSYEHAADFFEYDNYMQYVAGQPELYLQTEIDFFAELAEIETYYGLIQGIDAVYEQLDVAAIAQFEIDKYGFSGAAANTVLQRYAKLDTRLNQLIANGEHKTMFFWGKAYEMHSLLFKTLFGTMMFELLVLVVLITGYVTKYEFENRTQSLVYSTKRGRNLAVDKLFVSLAATVIVTTVIIGFALAVYFSTYSYSGLWQVPISSYFNGEKFPLISWWEMSVLTYLLGVVIVVYFVQLLFSAIAFLLAHFLSNSYLVLVGFAICYGGAILLSSLIPLHSNAVFISYFTPFHLILNPHRFFTEGGAFLTFKGYEMTTISCWMVLLTIACLFTLKRFKHQSI